MNRPSGLGSAASVLLLAMPQTARAHAAGVANIALDVTRYDSAEHIELDAQGLAGLDLRGILTPGDAPIGYAAGLGYRFGMTLPAGFAYGAELLPLGVGILIEGFGFLSITSGGGLSGVTGRVPFSLELSGEARLFVDLPGSISLTSSLELAWLDDDARRSGSELSVSDEARALLGVRIGRERTKYDFDFGSGALIALTAHEWLGIRGFGLTIGHSLDAVQSSAAP